MSSHEISSHIHIKNRPKNEMLSLINSLNYEKLEKLGYRATKRDWWPLEIYHKDDFVIVPVEKFYEGVSPKEYQQYQELRKDTDYDLRYLDVNHPLNTPMKLIRAAGVVESFLFPKSLGRSVFEYRGLFGIKTNPLLQRWPEGSINSVLKSNEFGMRFLNIETVIINDKIVGGIPVSFFVTEETILDVETIDAMMRGFKDYLDQLKSYLHMQDIIDEIKNDRSMINAYLSKSQTLEFINLIFQMETISSEEFLDDLSKNELARNILC
jgi:hypothetical protein